MLLPPKNNGVTPVFIAAQNGHVDALQALHDLGAKIDLVHHLQSLKTAMRRQVHLHLILNSLKDLFVSDSIFTGSVFSDYICSTKPKMD